MALSDILKMIRYDYQASRVFPYLHYLIILFPFLALLINHGHVNVSMWLIAYVLPFVFADAAGFTYNTICDSSKDPKKKNPITRGDLSKHNAFASLAILLTLSVVSFFLIYRSILSMALFLFFILLWLAYSGFSVRFKETILAPPVASIVLWAGPPLILMAEFNYFGIDSLLLLAGIFAVYIGHEIKHTLIDHDEDMMHDCTTFAIITGKKISSYLEYLSLATGYLLFIASLYAVRPPINPAYLFLFIALFGAALATTMIYGIKMRFDHKTDVLPITLPYMAAKVFIIIYGCIMLQLPDLLIVFVIWIFVMGKYP